MSWLSMLDSGAGLRTEAGVPVGPETGASVALTIFWLVHVLCRSRGLPFSIRAGITWSMSPLVSWALSLTLQSGFAS